MNTGAKAASGDVLYFLHADSFPPPLFMGIILQALSKRADSGCFYLRFDRLHWFINAVALLTRFNTSFIRFGDQSLFIRKSLLEKIGGFDERCIVMEDHEIIKRIAKNGRFQLLQFPLVTSSRKFFGNGPLRLMLIYLYIYLLYYLNKSQPMLLKTYRRLVSNGKL